MDHVDAKPEALTFCPRSRKGANPELPLGHNAILDNVNPETLAVCSQDDAVRFHRMIPIRECDDSAF